MDKVILNPIIPYLGRIDGDCKFVPQKIIKIQGVIPKIAWGFYISLQCGPNASPNDDIALQISVELLKGYICLNSLSDGIWGNEIRKSTLPIETDEEFEILVSCGADQYKVTINGKHYCDFPQIIRYDKISHLAIKGDVCINQICYDSDSVGLTTNKTENTNIFDANEPQSSSRITLLSCDNDSVNIQQETLLSVENDALIPIKGRCKCKDVCYVFVILFALFSIIGGLIYWFSADDGTNVTQIKYGLVGGYGWYNKHVEEEPEHIII